MTFIIHGADAKTGKDRRIEVEADDERAALAKAKTVGVFPYRVEVKPVAPCNSPTLNSSTLPAFTSNDEWTEAMNRVNEPSGQTGDADAPLRCPSCKSTQLTANKKGFGLGKAAVGGILLGPVGLLGGLIGSGKIKITCLKCGKVFDPGQGK